MVQDDLRYYDRAVVYEGSGVADRKALLYEVPGDELRQLKLVELETLIRKRVGNDLKVFVRFYGRKNGQALQDSYRVPKVAAVGTGDLNLQLAHENEQLRARLKAIEGGEAADDGRTSDSIADSL